MGAPQDDRGYGLYCPSCEQTFARGATGERCPHDNTRLVRIAAAVDTLIGRELDGRYTIIEKLGQGGMGAVYRGTQHSVGRDIAIKVVTPSLVSEPDVIKRFLREAKLSSRLAHPNAVSVLDFGQTDDNLFYLVMELVAGRTLDAVIQQERLSPARLVRIGVQICDALEGAHTLGIVHRDLKPQNVMVMSTGRDLVKVLDFGIAKSLTPDHSSTTITNAGALLGTPAFMPPELVSGGACDARADLYSLGCLLFAAGTGRLPFEASSVNELIAMHACEPAPPAEGLPTRLQAVIGKLLEKNPAQRFPSAVATRDALEAALAGEAVVEAIDTGDHSTKLGWSGQFTAPAKGQRRVATPVSGVNASPPASHHSVRIGLSSVPPDQQDLYASSETLLADPAPPLPVPPPARSRKGLWIALGGGLVLAAGALTFVLVRGGDKQIETALPTEPKVAPSITAPITPAKRPLEPPPSEASAPPAQTSAPPTTAAPGSSLTTPIPTPPISKVEDNPDAKQGTGTARVSPPRAVPAAPGSVADTIPKPKNRPSSVGGADLGGPVMPRPKPLPSKKNDPKKDDNKPEPKPVTINPGVE